MIPSESIKCHALDALETVLKSKWQTAHDAFEASKAGATSGEVKQESKYDTRGLEASYLAHGLANAVTEYEAALADLNTCRLAPMTSTISIGSLIHCTTKTGHPVYFLLSKSGGGIEAPFQESDVTIITPTAPLAKALLGKSSGDSTISPAFKILNVY